MLFNNYYLFKKIVIILLFLFLHLRHSDEQGGKSHEHIRLDETYQTFQQGHEHHKQYGNHGNTQTCHDAHLREDEDQTDQHQHHHVTREHVREETYTEGDRLREDTQDLDELHDRDRQLQAYRHMWPKDILPVGLRSEDIRQQEGQHSEHQGNRDVTRQVRSTREDRNDTQNIVEEDEEEDRQQIGGELLVILSNTRFDDIVMQRDDERLQYRLQPRRFAITRFLALVILLRDGEEDNQQKRATDQQRDHVLRDGQVHRTLSRRHLDDLSGIVAFLRDLISIVLLVVALMAQPGSTKDVQTVFPIDDTRERR